jgi:hypothetical protein
MSIVTKRMSAWTAAAAASVLVAGCGGGGSDAPASGGPTPVAAPRVTITSANASSVTAEAIAAAGAGDVGPTLAGLLGVEVSGQARPPAPMAALVSATRRALAWQPPLATVGVTISQTAPCSGGGTLAVSGTVADANRDTAGDRLSVTFSACVEAGERLDGTFALTIAAVNATETSYRLELAATNFGITSGGVGERLNGTLQIALDDTSPTQSLIGVSSASFSVDQLVGNTVRASRTLSDFDYRLALTTATGATSETFTFTASGNFGAIGSSPVSFLSATVTPVVTTSASALRPSSGSMRVTGSGGATVLATVISTGLRLAVDANGDGVAEETRDLTWAELDRQLGA